MIGISISDNSIGFMKCFKKTNLTHIEDFVMLQKKNPDITPANLNNIINRKKIRKSGEGVHGSQTNPGRIRGGPQEFVKHF